MEKQAFQPEQEKQSDHPLAESGFAGRGAASMSPPPFQPTAGDALPPAKPNNTGLPDELKSATEYLSGYSLDDVKVHYNSSEPSEFGAEAFAENDEIFVGPGKEKMIPHEVWHVVQQKQGRVQPTGKINGRNFNDDPILEEDADVMGEKSKRYLLPIEAYNNKELTVVKSKASVLQFSLKDVNKLVYSLKREYNYRLLEDKPRNYPFINKKDLANLFSYLDGKGIKPKRSKYSLKYNDLMDLFKSDNFKNENNSVRVKLEKAYRGATRKGKPGNINKDKSKRLQGNENTKSINFNLGENVELKRQDSISCQLGDIEDKKGKEAWPIKTVWEDLIKKYPLKDEKGCKQSIITNIPDFCKAIRNYGFNPTISWDLIEKKEIPRSLLLRINSIDFGRANFTKVQKDLVFVQASSSPKASTGDSWKKLVGDLQIQYADDTNELIKNIIYAIEGEKFELKKSGRLALGAMLCDTKRSIEGFLAYKNVLKEQLESCKEDDQVDLEHIFLGKRNKEPLYKPAMTKGRGLVIKKNRPGIEDKHIPKDDAETSKSFNKIGKRSGNATPPKISNLSLKHVKLEISQGSKNNRSPQNSHLPQFSIEPEDLYLPAGFNSDNMPQSKMELENPLNTFPNQYTIDNKKYFLKPEEIECEGSCFFDSLIALKVNQGNSREGLRNLASGNPEGTKDIKKDETYADEPDIRYLATKLDLTIRIISIDLHGTIIQDKTKGNGTNKIVLAQIWGAHFTPLRPI